MSGDISEELYHPSSYQPPSLCRRISYNTDLQLAPEESIHQVELMDAECETDVRLEVTVYTLQKCVGLTNCLTFSRVLL